ncbi:MAG: VWA domain-containing protein [Alphaproteobacteria bacterium]|nr:VWA domain-containing protein [Alphaproteobacteria bacterium]
MSADETCDNDRLRRWRLVLGGGDADGVQVPLAGDDIGLDASLEALYDADRAGSLGGSAPQIARWLGDIRSYFPSSSVRVMQKDALERLKLTRLLMEPELLESVEPDVELVATLLSLKGVIPARTRETARAVVRRVVEALERELAPAARAAVTGSLNRAARKRRPRPGEIDWPRTILKNLKTYQPELGSVIPETLVGFGRRRAAMQDIVLCVDQSASMAASMVYAGVFGAVLAGLRAVRTHMVVFDTEVVDLTERLADPVELLFSVQLGGGTDIGRALGYCKGLVQRPSETLLVLISDLFEGGDRDRLLRRVAELRGAGVQVVCLLALSDQGAPAWHHDNAAAFAGLGVPTFACTPDRFPSLMAAAIQREDVGLWAARQGIVTARPEDL